MRRIFLCAVFLAGSVSAQSSEGGFARFMSEIVEGAGAALKAETERLAGQEASDDAAATSPTPAPAEVGAPKEEQSVAGDFVAEDQTPSGKFTTATEVKPILEMTRNNWVAVREYDGKDLLYVTHLMAWRCGVHELKVGLNGAVPTVWELPRCQTDMSTPNAIPDDQVLLIYRSYELGSIESIAVELLLDDMSTLSESFERKAVMIP